jgi:type II secretory pathway pseudopilin PulG
MPHRFARTAGHTLIESMFAAFLALICALIFSATIPVANFTRGKAENMNAATSLAQKVMERVRNEGYANTTHSRLVTVGLADSATLVNTSTYGCGPTGEQAMEFTNMEGSLIDSPATVLPSGRGFIYSQQVGIDVRRVNVIVNWQEGSTRKSVRLSTLVANL